MSSRDTAIAPIHKTISVAVPPERAFAFFTAHTQEWWPLRTHSVGQEASAGIEFGQGVGEEIVETLADGSKHVWGVITAWNPPSRVVHTWHAGAPQEEATQVEVLFTAEDGGRTRVDLIHTGWERRSGDAAAMRDQYDGGWDGPLGAYAAQLS